MRKFTAVLLLFALCLCVSACSGENAAPEGMKDAAVSGAEFHLYVPESWVLNNESGISGAYVSANERSNVYVTSHLPDSAMTAETYFLEVCLPAYQNGTLADFQLLEDQCGDTTLGGLNAKKYVYIYALGDNRYETMQVIVSTGNMIYNLIYTASSTAFADYLEDVESIIANFSFR